MPHSTGSSFCPGCWEFPILALVMVDWCVPPGFVLYLFVLSELGSLSLFNLLPLPHCHVHPIGIASPVSRSCCFCFCVWSLQRPPSDQQVPLLITPSHLTWFLLVVVFCGPVVAPHSIPCKTIASSLVFATGLFLSCLNPPQFFWVS